MGLRGQRFRLRQSARERQGPPEKILHKRIVRFDRAHALERVDSVRLPPGEELDDLDLPLHIE